MDDRYGYADDGDDEAIMPEELFARLYRLTGVPADVEDRYEVARADFRLRRGNLLRQCIAAIVDAAFVIADPTGVQFLGENPDAASAYDAVAARVWFRLGDAWLDLDHTVATSDESGDDDSDAGVPLEVVARIVHEQLCEEFGGDSGVDATFATIIADEYGSDAAEGLGAWQQVEWCAGLIHAGLSTMPVPRAGRA